MARVLHVKARKDYPNAGIKKGDMYYRWQQGFRGPIRMSKERPKASQTTGSAFLQSLYTICETRDGFAADDSLEDACQQLAQELRDLADETQNSLDSMPEGLQQGDTGQMLEERIAACESAADELEGIDFSFDASNKEDPEQTDEEYEQEFWEKKLEEVNDVSIEAP